MMDIPFFPSTLSEFEIPSLISCGFPSGNAGFFVFSTDTESMPGEIKGGDIVSIRNHGTDCGSGWTIVF
jgi:hypothetical protein